MQRVVVTINTLYPNNGLNYCLSGSQLQDYPADPVPYEPHVRPGRVWGESEAQETRAAAVTKHGRPQGEVSRLVPGVLLILIFIGGNN